jgi:hypothetical protein
MILNEQQILYTEVHGSLMEGLRVSGVSCSSISDEPASRSWVGEVLVPGAASSAVTRPALKRAVAAPTAGALVDMAALSVRMTLAAAC